jgi:DNA-binding CsgD family transcriptional regulator
MAPAALVAQTVAQTPIIEVPVEQRALLVAALGRVPGRARVPGWRERAAAEERLGFDALLGIGCALSDSTEWPFHTALQADLRRFTPRFFRAAWGLRQAPLAFGSMGELSPLIAEGLAIETVRSEPEFTLLSWRGGEAVSGHFVAYLTGLLQALGEQAFPGASVQVRLLDLPEQARSMLPQAWSKRLGHGPADQVRWHVRFGPYVAHEEGVSAVLAAVVPGHRSSASERVVESLMTLGLSERQAEVSFYVAQGMDRRSIAAKLGLGVETVKHHRRRVTTLLCLPSTIALCRLVWALEHH